MNTVILKPEVTVTKHIFDYNNYYTAGNCLINRDGVCYPNLSIYQSTYSENDYYDESSLSLNPAFVSSSNLTPQSFLMDDMGTSGLGVSEDINGTNRSASTPDMGAVEYTASEVALSGDYSIGSGGDFSSISEAVSALNMQGVSAAVTFNINPGEYQEQVEILPISGSGISNCLPQSSQ